MSFKSSCFYFRPSKAFSVLSVIFLVSGSTPCVFGDLCRCDIPSELSHIYEQSCGSPVANCKGGCAKEEYLFHAPASAIGKRYTVKGCGVGTNENTCISKEGDHGNYKWTETTCVCRGHLCNSEGSRGATSAPNKIVKPVQCYCETPEEDARYSTSPDFDCKGKSKITCASGGCATLEIEYLAPKKLKGKKAIAKGCKDRSSAECWNGDGPDGDINSHFKKCTCNGNLCNNKTSPYSKRKKSKGKTSKNQVGGGSVYLRSNFPLLTSCLFATAFLSLFLFNRK